MIFQYLHSGRTSLWGVHRDGKKKEPKSKMSLKARLTIIIFHLIDPFFCSFKLLFSTNLFCSNFYLYNL